MKHISEDPEVGRRTSDELTEARTVLSRAESALERFEWIERYVSIEDPEHEKIHAALTKVVELLAPFRRTGRPRRAAR